MAANDDEVTVWLAVRADLAMPPGKLAAQAGHGFSTVLLDAYRRNPALVDAYQAASMKKSVVVARNEGQLRRVEREAEAAGIGRCLVVDEGRTVFGEPTATVCAFGPCRMSDLPKFLARLRLMPDPAAGGTGPDDEIAAG